MTPPAVDNRTKQEKKHNIPLAFQTWHAGIKSRPYLNSSKDDDDDDDDDY